MNTCYKIKLLEEQNEIDWLVNAMCEEMKCDGKYGLNQ